MNVLNQQQPAPSPLPGIAHATWAGSAQGLSQLSLWRQSIAPGGATPPHVHGCDEVVLCLAGHGQVHFDGRVMDFGPESTVVLPKDQVHQLVNTGSAQLEVLGIFGSSPVGTRLPDGTALQLPWPT